MSKLKKFAKALCAALLCMAMVNNAMAAVVTYYHNDISGSPIAATDAAGNLKWKESYKPYGDKLTRSAASTDNDIGFHGKAHDDSSGLSYMGARYYDPVLGRFMGVDPVDFQVDNLHSFNRYTYTNNNPYRYVDPDGNYAFLIPLAIYALTALAAVATVQSTMSGFGNQPQAGVSIGPLSFPGADLGNPAQWQSANEHTPTVDTSTGSDTSSEKASTNGQRPSKTPNTGEPGSRFTNPGSGQERWYGSDGLPVKDVDWDHDHGQGIPHVHEWGRSDGGAPVRGKGRPFDPSIDK